MILSSPVLPSFLTTLPLRLSRVLQDIATNVTIEPNFCIRHPQYQPFQVPAEMTGRFDNIPADLRQKYLSLQLRSFLYGIYYNGSLQAELALENSSQPKTRFQNLENNTYLGMDVSFMAQLHECNGGEGYFSPGWQVVQQLSEDSFAVYQGGLTLQVNRQQHLAPEVVAAVGEKVAIRMPRNLMQNGFYVAVGNAGSKTPGQSEQTVRVYFNLTSQGAQTVMAALTRHLNSQRLPFIFKVLYNPADYQRHDSGVLYIERSHYSQVRGLLGLIYAEHQPHFRPSEPLFTKRLAPGMGLAEEPNRKFTQVESFGQNRCQIVAKALLEENTKNPLVDSDQRLMAIQNQFQQVGLDLTRPYLNAGSEDVYMPLAL